MLVKNLDIAVFFTVKSGFWFDFVPFVFSKPGLTAFDAVLPICYARQPNKLSCPPLYWL